MAETEKLYMGPYEFGYAGIMPADIKMEPFDMAALQDAIELVKNLRMTNICKDGVDRCAAMVESGRKYDELEHTERTLAWLVLAAVNRHVRVINEAVRQQAT